MDSTPRGLFATRAPKRPNAIGMSVVTLRAVVDRVLHIEGVDVLDGTPLLDIKPHVAAFDAPPNSCAGWLEGAGDSVATKRSDGRFS